MKKKYQKVLLVCSVCLAGVMNAQDTPIALYYSDYTGDSFVANWEKVGSDSKSLLSVFKAGENVLVTEDLEKLTRRIRIIRQAGRFLSVGPERRMSVMTETETV